ncbi:MAG TPA: glutamyl-tRNA reductase [Clostridia bacterium]|nr:glutamyl-tRNA reductase [Clostridia bacterium]
MEPSIVVIGLDFRTASIAVRERFWISDSRRVDAMRQLVRSEGVEEAVVLATCNRTEFIVWASDPPEAANSVLRFLTRDYDLKLCEWSSFYRLIDDDALLHVFRIASALDAMMLDEPESMAEMKNAWHQGQKAGTTGRCLDAILQKALSVATRVRNETAIGSSAVSLPYAAVQLSKEIFGSLDNRKVVLVGAGKMNELAAHYLTKHGVHRLCVTNRTFEHAAKLVKKVGGIAVPFEDRWPHMMDADIIVSSTSSPHYMVSKQDAETMMRDRENRPLVLIDTAVPRNIDPAVREVHGVVLYDVDDMGRVARQNTTERQAAATAADGILHEEADGFRRKLIAEPAVPAVVALRSRLEEICQQELQMLGEEFGPFTEDQSQALSTLAAHITQRIAGSLARELKELPDRGEQEALSTAVQRLFHLELRQVAPSIAKH